MALIPFQQPEKIIQLEGNERCGSFEFKPLEPGYGITIGNSLRRILLASLEGYAITSIKIDSVDHEFSTIKGVVEDVTNIILNLKQLRFKKLVDDIDSEKLVVNISGKEKITAGDLSSFMSSFQVLNPNIEICNLEPSVNFQIEILIEKGRGYVPADENKPLNAPIGVIAMDATFTPIKNVKYHIENFRVEQKTDYEKLIITVETDGSVTPKNALKEAAKILIKHFMLFSDEKITLDSINKLEEEEFDETSLHMRQLLKTKLVDLDLSVRALNCLKAADIETLGNLVEYNKNDLLKFRNFGKKSLTELDNLLQVKGLTFGMDISKYKLDQE